MTVGKGKGTILFQLPVNPEIHLAAIHGGVGHGLFVAFRTFIMKFFQIAASACSGPAPAFSAACQLRFPAPGIVGSPGRFKFKDMFFAFFRDDVDNTAGRIITQKAVAHGAMQNFDAVNGHNRRCHIQIVGCTSVGKTAFQILPAAINEHSDTVIAVDTDHLVRRVDRTGGDGYTGSVHQGLSHGFVVIVFHFFCCDNGSESRRLP